MPADGSRRQALETGSSSLPELKGRHRLQRRPKKSQKQSESQPVHCGVVEPPPAGTSMEGEGGSVGRSPEVGQGEERPEGPPAPNLPSLVAHGPPGGQAKSTPQVGMGPLPESGASNLGFAEDPPPYSPPDPKAVHHLLYPAFQANVPGRGPIFYQPTALPQAAAQQPNLLPFAIYNSALFQEVPIEADRRNPPKSYMVESVLVTVFCCMLTGVAALVYSHETRSALKRGDLGQAQAASEKARLLVIFSLAFGVFVSISWVIYVVATLYL